MPYTFPAYLESEVSMKWGYTVKFGESGRELRYEGIAQASETNLIDATFKNPNTCLVIVPWEDALELWLIRDLGCLENLQRFYLEVHGLKRIYPRLFRFMNRVEIGKII